VDLGRVLQHQARFSWDSRVLIPSRPPTHPRVAARQSATAVKRKAGAAGVPSNGQDAGAAAEDTPGGLGVP